MRAPKNYYDLLDIDQDAKREDIALAYQRALEALAREHDTNPTTRAALRKAFDVLSDPIQRVSYNLTARSHAVEPHYSDDVSEEDDSLAARFWASHWGKAFVAAVILIALVMWMKPGKPSGTGISVNTTQISSTTVAGKPPTESDSGTGSPANARAESKATTATGATGARSAEEVFSQVSASVVRINVANAVGVRVSSGSGVVIGSGTVITNCHVALGGEMLEVKLGGTSYSASVEVADEERDLCRLGVSGLNAPAVTIGSVESLRVGQRVFAIGAPQGLDLTISDGIVSALREAQGSKMIQTSAPVSPGSSGGGLFDTSARLVGIVTFQTKVGQNLNFAVPADWVSDIRNR